ncbi:hypothetical protein [Leeia sp.]|uniref:hypothetical protein n=1 Tax=Leeia sp. TaxID=2884678 RepID=UPI0035B3FE43
MYRSWCTVLLCLALFNVVHAENAPGANAASAQPERVRLNSKTGLLGSKTYIDYVTDFKAWYPIGLTFNGTVEFDQRQFPLPAGDWTVMVTRGRVVSAQYQDGTTEPSAAEVTLALFQHDGPHITKWLFLQSRLPTPKRSKTWFSLHSICKDSPGETTFANQKVSVTEDLQYCGVAELDDIRDTAKIGPAGRDAVAYLASRQYIVPTLMTTHSSILTKQGDMLFIALSYNTDAPSLGLSSTQNWQTPQLNEAQKKRYQAINDEGSALQRKLAEAWGFQ